jgi:prophage tail gpP-like protein
MMQLFINDRFHNRKVDFFNEVQVNLKYDSVASTFSFLYYFNPKNPDHKEMACVSHFHDVTLKYNDETLITGVLLQQRFSHRATKQLASFGGYSRPGVLEDCTIDPNSYPLQSDGLSVASIARRVIAGFNPKIELVIDPAVSSRANEALSTSTALEQQRIKQYLTEIATQKQIIVSHDEFGNLLLTEATKKKPILSFDLSQGSIPGVEFDFDFNGQGMHSHITLMKQASIDGGNAGQNTIRNPYVVGSVTRPVVQNQSSGNDNDTGLAARQALSSELRNIRLTVKLDRWTVDGKIIRPNNLIEIIDHELFFYKKTTWFIESVTLNGNETSETATLNCVLPEVYTYETPVSIFSGINIHPRT